MINAGRDVRLLARAIHDRGVLLINHDPLGTPEHVDRHALELYAEVGRHQGTAGKDRDVFEHCLTAIAETRSLDGRDLEAAAQLVDDEGRERLALYVLGNDKQWFAGLRHGLEERQ